MSTCIEYEEIAPLMSAFWHRSDLEAFPIVGAAAPCPKRAPPFLEPSPASHDARAVALLTYLSCSQTLHKQKRYLPPLAQT